MLVESTGLQLQQHARPLHAQPICEAVQYPVGVARTVGGVSFRHHHRSPPIWSPSLQLKSCARPPFPPPTAIFASSGVGLVPNGVRSRRRLCRCRFLRHCECRQLRPRLQWRLQRGQSVELLSLIQSFYCGPRVYCCCSCLDVHNHPPPHSPRLERVPGERVHANANPVHVCIGMSTSTHWSSSLTCDPTLATAWTKYAPASTLITTSAAVTQADGLLRRPLNPGP
jgi:hypothetical protein